MISSETWNKAKAWRNRGTPVSGVLLLGRGPPGATAVAPNRLQTTYVPAGVLYLVEQLPHCDPLRLCS